MSRISKPIRTLTEHELTRFWSCVPGPEGIQDKHAWVVGLTRESPCIYWQGTRSKTSIKNTAVDYPTFVIPLDPGQGWGNRWSRKDIYKAHRVMYHLVRGSLDPLLTLDHDCIQPMCVNPWHCEQISQSENTKRVWSRRRANGLTDATGRK